MRCLTDSLCRFASIQLGTFVSSIVHWNCFGCNWIIWSSLKWNVAVNCVCLLFLFFAIQKTFSRPKIFSLSDRYKINIQTTNEQLPLVADLNIWFLLSFELRTIQTCDRKLKSVWRMNCITYYYYFAVITIRINRYQNREPESLALIFQDNCARFTQCKLNARMICQIKFHFWKWSFYSG